MPWSEPYRSRRRPPAFVAMLPPMWQLANILSYLNNDCWLGCINGSFYLPSLGTKVQRHHITLLGKPIIQDFQDTASIGGENAWEIIIKRVSKVATRFRRLGKKTLPDTLSKPRILFMPCKLMTTSSKTGTDPPTRPVLPPWGTTAILTGHPPC